MPLPDDYLAYPWRRHGMDHHLYLWSQLKDRKAIAWPGGQGVALWITVHVEWHPLNPSGKPFKAPGAMQTPYPDLRHFTTRDYGNRVGIYRLLRVLGDRGLKASFAVQGRVAERYPMLVREIAGAGHEIVAHSMHMDTLHHGGLSEDEERALIARTVDVLQDVSGQRVQGWLSPAKQVSARTLELLAELGLAYTCDWPNDDMPYRMTTPKGAILSMPHSSELSDRAILIQNHCSEDEWRGQLCDQFAGLAAEAATQGGRIMSVPLTTYIAGLPYRIASLEAALDAMKGAWVATGAEIAEAWAGQNA